MFVVTYRNSILGMGESEEQVVKEATSLLENLELEEKFYVLSRLQVAAISQNAFKQISSNRTVTLRRVDSVLEAI
ncbi:hypothetical protein SAMN04488518_11391 [Pseudovibrio ascidiaceicola]|uniref:Uncharacterized protein n=1 Tax=Pseudovibrio ascidiaceicola TaxID=285279 RepID=A0A1I4E1X2_9HYPH|nr:hypothetical protein [Pseudovibrio ascidiaceicola]SFK98980.1 hypothetical protein SAMN04488518_11391 [Pseudovibrio ascidiaceicola]